MDQRDGAWWTDRLVQGLVFIGGISGIVFVVGIFVFVTKEGLGFVVETLDLGQFFTSIAWRPTSANPTYGALALIVGNGKRHGTGHGGFRAAGSGRRHSTSVSLPPGARAKP